nr:unnamed protein product [Callosobruchus analis]
MTTLYPLDNMSEYDKPAKKAAGKKKAPSKLPKASEQNNNNRARGNGDTKMTCWQRINHGSYKLMVIWRRPKPSPSKSMPEFCVH